MRVRGEIIRTVTHHPADAGSSPETISSGLLQPTPVLTGTPLRELRAIALAAMREYRAKGGELEFHPLGIVRLSFSGNRHGNHYHLHLFSKDWPNRRYLETPHSHAWKLTSTILHGTLVNEEWEISDEAEGEYLKVPMDGQYLDKKAMNRGSTALFSEATPCAIRLVSSRSLAPGETYRMGVDEAHITKHTEDVMTLIHKDYVSDRSFFTVSKTEATLKRDKDHYAMPDSFKNEAWDRIERYLQGEN